LRKNIENEWRLLIIPEILFEFGEFSFERITKNNVPLIKGKFNLSVTPRFNYEFGEFFWFYDLNTKQIDSENALLSLGPYYPWWVFENDKIIYPNLAYPAFSDILLNSKSGKLHRAPSSTIIGARKEQLKILSNFFANYLKTIKIPLNYDKIIPVPAKPEYSFNSIEIICHEFSKILEIPTDCDILKRVSNEQKDYEVIDRSINLSNIKILLIDDITTDGDTKDFICSRLNELGCINICNITLGKTDHQILF